MNGKNLRRETFLRVSKAIKANHPSNERNALANRPKNSKNDKVQVDFNIQQAENRDKQQEHGGHLQKFF